MSVGMPSVLLTDLYQLTMAHAYFDHGMGETAVFELFVRRLPGQRRFLLSAGLEQVLEYLEGLRFGREELECLARVGTFPTAFLDYLAGLRFTGSVHAMPEGTPFFANEPILRVTAPIIEAQLVESRIINLMHFQTLIASKAVRCVMAARGRHLSDFGMRRAHGAEAALLASRAAFLAGFDSTATVEAGCRFGIPLVGTMAHSFIQAHDSEEQALRRFLETRPGDVTLLIDTYDTERGAHRAALLASEPQAAERAGRVRAVRVDSGELDAECRAVRRILDSHGCQGVRIVVSGNLDEYRIEALLAAGVPVDVFGVGTHLDVSVDAPTLDFAYKLQEYAGRARRKRSPGKETLPGRKQVFRDRDAAGMLAGDTIALAEESLPGEPLLVEVMRDGRRSIGAPSLSAIRDYCRQRVAELPPALRELSEGTADYPVRVSDQVKALAKRVDARSR